MAEGNEKVDEKVRALCAGRPEFAPLFEFLLSKKRSVREITADQLLAGCDLAGIVPQQRRRLVVDFFRFLEGLRVGTTTIGRRGKKTRFEFKRSLSELSAIVTEPSSKASAGTAKEEIPGASKVTEASASLFLHRFPVRQDFTLEFSLPVDLTRDEAERLSSFIRALPLSRE